MRYNPILAADSYKLSHAFAYPSDVEGMFSYIESRTNGKDIIIPFGLQMFLKEHLMIPITNADIDEAEEFASLHGEPFARGKWQYIVDRYNGYFPVSIMAVPEGTPVRSGNILVGVWCTDPEVFWVTSYIEDVLLRAVWYPSSIASMDYEIKKDIAHFYRISGANMAILPFALHDFGARGVTCHEQAERGGAAHLVNFMGSDTMEGIRAANYYYKEKMAGFSVPATEHSVECSFGLDVEGEKEYIRNVLTNLAKPGGIVSIVIDGKDVYRCAEVLCTEFKDTIIASECKIVFRPDSGDMMEVVPRLLRMQELAFGYTTTSTGHKTIKYVGILQGDGVDHMSIRSLLGKILSLGYSADCVVFGSGGALLQKVNRDTYKWAMKASAIYVDKKWIGISKDPITDSGKSSKEGVLHLFRHKMTGEYRTIRTDQGAISNEFEWVMELVYKNGVMYNETTLQEVRERCKI